MVVLLNFFISKLKYMGGAIHGNKCIFFIVFFPDSKSNV